MSRETIIKQLEATGYTVKPYPKNNTGIVVYFGEGGKSDRGSRIQFLRETVAPAVNGKYQTTTSIKSSVGGVVVDGRYVIVTKPARDVNGSLASLDARIFSEGGKRIKFTYADETFDAVEFTDNKTLKNSIVAGVQKANMLDSALADSLQSLFDGYGMAWGKDTDMATKNKLGVYLGELLIGLVAMSAPGRSDYLATNPFGTQRFKRFVIPTDPAFSGVDSFVEMSDGTLFPISSKFGVGAKASIFANLMPKAVLKGSSKLGNSVLGKLVRIIERNNLKPTDSKAIMYNYGVYEILGIKPSEIKNPNLVYEQIRTNKPGKEATIAIARAAAFKPLPSAISQFKPMNMSSLFNNVLAQRLNADKTSMQQIAEILAGKKYWQMNLDQRLWQEGTMRFNAVLSGDASVKIIGNKSPSTDITSKQGWVNYELRLT